MHARSDLFELLTRLRSAERDYDGRVERRLGIGTKDLAALRIIGIAASRDEIVHAVDLAGALRITTAAVSLLIDRLVRAGYVARLPDPSDGRGRILCLTASAQKAMQETDLPTYGAIRALAEQIPDDEAVRFGALLDAVSRVLEGRPSPLAV